MPSPSTAVRRVWRFGLTGAALVAILLGTVTAPDAFAQNRYSLKIHNESKITVTEIYVENAEHKGWGPEEMKSFVLSPGKTFTLTGIKPGEYHIKFVGAKGHECILTSYAIVKDQSWRLTTEWLRKCRNWSE